MMINTVSEALKNVCEPLLANSAFQRLNDVTFLGILSPRFLELEKHPLKKINSVSKRIRDDGSRADHSIGVAELTLQICERLALSEQTMRYAGAWALLHDIATWPLSHTGEAAFQEITNVKHKSLRASMVAGDKSLPSRLCVKKDVERMGLDADIVIRLFSKTSRFEDFQLNLLHDIIHSAITPDTLEGIYRSGRSIGISVPEPSAFVSLFGAARPDFFQTISMLDSHIILKFWRAKSKVYERYINNRYSISFESDWSNAILHQFNGYNLVDSLDVSEHFIIESVGRKGILPCENTRRYKAPQKYMLDASLKRKRRLQDDRPVSALRQLLVSSSSGS